MKAADRKRLARERRTRNRQQRRQNIVAGVMRRLVGKSFKPANAQWFTGVDPAAGRDQFVNYL